MLPLINPVARAEAVDHPDWVFEVKFDGFRVAADTVRGRLILRNGNWVRASRRRCLIIKYNQHAIKHHYGRIHQ